MTAVEVITSVGRRRRWSRDEKLRIVAEPSRPGRTASRQASVFGHMFDHFGAEYGVEAGSRIIETVVGIAGSPTLPSNPRSRRDVRPVLFSLGLGKMLTALATATDDQRKARDHQNGDQVKEDRPKDRSSETISQAAAPE